MKKILTGLTLFLLINKLSYCQEIYPKVLFIDQDTLVALTPRQCKVINKTFEENKVLKKENIVMINSMDSLMECLSEIDTILLKDKEMIESLVLEVDTLIIEHKELKEKNLKLEEHVEENKKYIKISFLAGLGLGLGVLLVLL